MAVGRRDDPELERVDAEAFFLSETVDQRVAHEVEPRLAAFTSQPADAGAVLAVRRPFAVDVAHLLEVAELVFAADDAPHAAPALGIALGLHDLDQHVQLGLKRRLRPLLFDRHAAPVDREHLTVRDVRVVGDRQRLAAGAGVVAARLEPGPEVERFGGVHPGDRQFGGDLVAQNDVAMHLGQARHAGVLPGVEGREGTVARAVVVAFRGRPGIAPGGKQTFAAAAAVLAAESCYPAGEPVVHPRGAFLWGASRPHAAARRFVVERRRRVGAHGHLAQPLRVVGHCRKVQGTDELGGAGRLSVVVERTEIERLAAGEAVGVVGRLEAAAAEGVQGKGGVGVEIAEEGLAERVALGARLAWN